ncbi:MAG: 50S ribosomal protein L18 [Armatimonadota bacterium]|nr:50S ribosomal protein L18 [Armatimonadota bacterium]
MHTRPDRNLLRQRRHLRARRRLVGRATRPRLSVYRSLKQIYAQLIDDETGRTLAATSTLDPEVRPLVAGKTKVEAARVVGQILAQRALASGITRVIFDRGGYRYHGRVQALAEAARAAGLHF